MKVQITACRIANSITSQSRTEGWVAEATSQAGKRSNLKRVFARARAEGIEVVDMSLDMGACVARFGLAWNQLGVKKDPENTAIWLPHGDVSGIPRP
ncbi:hypothetical protein ACVWZ4_001950 [Bradyrhizobium sp. USDA 4472]